MPEYLKPGEPTDNIPYDTDFNPRPATEIKPGVTLLTKDGRQIGNAIVVERNGHTSSFPGSRDYIPLWKIETDFGNRIDKITEQEIHTLFTLGFERDYRTWAEDRRHLLLERQSSS